MYDKALVWMRKLGNTFEIIFTGKSNLKRLFKKNIAQKQVWEEF